MLSIHFFNCIKPWRLRAAGAALVLMGLASTLHATSAPSAQAAQRVVKVGVYTNPPKIFMGQDGQPSGILGELLVAMAQREHWTLQPVACEWQACLNALQEGRLDLMPDVAFTEQRAQIFDFHNTPALQSWSQLYKSRGEPIQSMLDLKGKRIAVVAGSIQANFLKDLLASFAIQAELVPVVSFERGFEQVKAHEVDAVAANRFFGDMQAVKYHLESTAIVFQPAQLYYATAKGRGRDLLEAIDRDLSLWQSQTNSPYTQALHHWLQASEHVTIPPYLWWVLTGLSALLALTLGAAHWLRRQVTQKTAHLLASEDRLKTILNGVEAFIYIKDQNLRYQYANSKVQDLYGYSAEQVVGLTDTAFFDAATATKLRVNDLRVIEKGERVEEEENIRSADGSIEHSYWTVKLPLRHPDGSIYALCGISTDITKRKQSEEAIHQLAFFDALTGLPNRRLLQDRVQQLLTSLARTPHGAALLFVDVDNFKDINDTLGHDAGDALLCQMATRMGECIRAQDTLARQSGDEFVVMLVELSTDPETAASQAQHVGQKILSSVCEPFTLGIHRVESSVSIGVALIDNPSRTRDELFKQADLAMYQAKADGRNTLRFFNPTMQAQVIARTSLEADLRWALKSQEFVLYYQPQVDAQANILGYEALIRWNHPMRGLVPPVAFIPAAESCGVILALGRWILHTACQQLVAWSRHDTQSHWTIAVNVSAYQFRQADFVSQVQAALQDTGANAALLELELTESQLVDDVDSVIAKMTALKALGVRLSLDDFGTGYSSLNMLKRLPLDQLKIDQSFVRDMRQDPQDEAIIRAIITIGESLSLTVIAEGVETIEQRDALLQLGCPHFQGYLFGKPAPMDIP
jgi:diguanylate cyclase (GGDEF)-like protein/PAS domain S-box-containing protein